MNGQFTIALFDSGVGGLSVLRQFLDSASQSSNKYMYLGDTARCPYGGRSAEEIRSYVAQIVQWLEKAGADAIVMACNTSCAQARDVASESTKLPIFDLVSATAEYVAARKLARVGVLATELTVSARAFSRAIEAAGADTEVFEIACPDLVSLVEKGFIDEPSSASTLAKYADEIARLECEALVLGCTHFPFFEPVLRKLLPETISIIDPARFIADKVSSYFMPDGIATTSAIDASETDISGMDISDRTHSVDIFVTGKPQDFAFAAQKCVGRDLGTVYGITLADLVAGIMPEAVPQNAPLAVVANAAVGGETV